jgi:hypothetical protein
MECKEDGSKLAAHQRQLLNTHAPNVAYETPLFKFLVIP